MSWETDKQNEIYDLVMEMRKRGCRMTRRDVLRLGAFAGLSVTGILPLLTACGPSTSGTPAAGGSSARTPEPTPVRVAGEENAQLTYWGAWGGTALNAEKLSVDKWNRLHPDMKVKALSVNDIDQKFLVAVAGRRPPDIIKLDRFMLPGYALSGAIQDLTDRINSDNIDVNQWFKACMDETKLNGKYYGLPWNTDDRGLWYNKEILEKEGIKEPPKDTDELRLMGKELTQRQGNRLKRIGFDGYGGNWQIGWHWAWGGEWLKDNNRRANWNNEIGEAWLTWLAENKKDLGGQQAVDVLSRSFQGEAQGPYWRGQIVMVCDGNWVAGDWKRYAPNVDMGVVPVPRPKEMQDKGPITWSGGFAFCLPEGVSDEKADAAWEFIKFKCTDEEVVLALARDTGQMPAIERLARDERYLSANKFNKTFVDLMPYSRFRDLTPVGQELWFDIIWPMPNDVFYGKKTVKQALADSEEKANKVLDRGWKEVERG